MTRGPFSGKHGLPHPSPLRKGGEGHTNKSKSSPRSPPHGSGLGGSLHNYTFWTCLKKATSPIGYSEQTLRDSSRAWSTSFRTCKIVEAG
jgi:hypothetical protein